MRTGWGGATGARAGAAGASRSPASSAAVMTVLTVRMLRGGAARLAEANRRPAAAGLLFLLDVLAADTEVLHERRPGGGAGAQARGHAEGDADPAVAELCVEDVRAVLGGVHPLRDQVGRRGQLALARAEVLADEVVALGVDVIGREDARLGRA